MASLDTINCPDNCCCSHSFSSFISTSMYSFHESLISFSSRITLPDTPLRQFGPVISYLSFTICFAIRKISFWCSESEKSTIEGGPCPYIVCHRPPSHTTYSKRPEMTYYQCGNMQPRSMHIRLVHSVQSQRHSDETRGTTPKQISHTCVPILIFPTPLPSSFLLGG